MHYQPTTLYIILETFSKHNKIIQHLELYIIQNIEIVFFEKKNMFYKHSKKLLQYVFFMIILYIIHCNNHNNNNYIDILIAYDHMLQNDCDIVL